MNGRGSLRPTRLLRSSDFQQLHLYMVLLGFSCTIVHDWAAIGIFRMLSASDNPPLFQPRLPVAGWEEGEGQTKDQRNIDDVDKTMDEINEQTENMKLIQEALATPMGAAAYFDEDELEAELEKLEGAELEEQLLQPATTASGAPMHVPAGKQQTRPAPRQNTAEKDELAALQAEMAL